MIRKFKFEKGQRWDGDEYILHVLEGYLLNDYCDEVKKDSEITLILERTKKKKEQKKK